MSSGRIRTIKGAWLEDELLAATSDAARVLSIALILMADDYGHGRSSTATFAAEAWRFELERDDGAHAPEVLAKVSRAYRELVDAGFVVPYEVGRQRYFWIRTWAKHQRVDKPGKPHVPPPPPEVLADIAAKYPDKSEATGIVATAPEIVATVSREPRDGLAPDRTGKEGKGEERKKTCASPPVVVDEPSRLAQALMLAHGALSPAAAAISGKSRSEAGATLHERARTLRAEIDDGTTIQALGDEVLTRFVEVFRSGTTAKAKGYPPEFLITALRGIELQRATDLVRVAHGRPVSSAWKGPQPPMKHVTVEGPDPFGDADADTTPDDGRPTAERQREAHARKRDAARYGAKGAT